MSDHFSQSELDRIDEFVATPKYERTPEMLLPEPDE